MAHAPTANGDAPVRIEAASAPLRRCRTCGAEKPWTQEYFKRRSRRRKDGSRIETAWFLDCNACELQRIRDHAAQKRAMQQAGITPPPPVAKALGSLTLPKPTRPDFRTVLQTKAQAKWPQIAGRMVDAAAKGDKAMIKLVAAYILGTPREATEDNGPTEFWHTLLARASERGAGPDPDLDAADDDPAPDSA
jgi:hypothetical protein